MTVRLRTSKNKLARCNPNSTLTSGSVNVDRVEVLVDESWGELGDVSFFLSVEKSGEPGSGGALALQNQNGVLACALPAMITATPSTWQIGLFAKNTQDTTVKASTVLLLTVEQGANTNGNTSFATPKFSVEYWYEEEIEQW